MHYLPSVSVRQLSSLAEIHSAKELRFAVWTAERVTINQAEQQLITDEHDDHGFHWGAFAKGLLVGAARLCLHSDLVGAPDGAMFEGSRIALPVASMNRLVVLEGYRGRGLGSLLDDVRIQRARDLGARTVIVAPVNIEARKRALLARGFHLRPGIVGRAS